MFRSLRISNSFQAINSQRRKLHLILRCGKSVALSNHFLVMGVQSDRASHVFECRNNEFRNSSSYSKMSRHPFREYNELKGFEKRNFMKIPDPAARVR